MQKILVIAQSLPAADSRAGCCGFSSAGGTYPPLPAFLLPLQDPATDHPHGAISAVAAHDAALRDLGISVQYGEWHVLNKLLHSNQF